MSIEVTSEIRSVDVGDGRAVGGDGLCTSTVRLPGASERGLSPSGVTEPDAQ